jgi:hypothetical protein
MEPFEQLHEYVFSSNALKVVNAWRDEFESWQPFDGEALNVCAAVEKSSIAGSGLLHASPEPIKENEVVGIYLGFVTPETEADHTDQS